MRAMHADLFEGSPTVTVSQKKEWLEILTDFERRNRFSIALEDRDGALIAREEGSRWARIFLGSMRPYTLVIETPQGKPVLRLHAPFRFIHREILVTDAHSKRIGRVRKRFTFPHTRYDVYDASGRHLFEIARGFVHIWTFTIRRDGVDHAVITKRWSGIGREVFTDADRFQLQFQQVIDPVERRILLGALFLIDFQHFEQGGS
jgi:uncharacterized protein YxjI